MQHHTHTALFTTVSGVVGCVGKAIFAKPLLLAITLPGLTTVIIYASASAVAGYVVKKLLDAASRKLTQFFNQKFSPEISIRSSLSDYRKEDWVVNLPLYACWTFVE